MSSINSEIQKLDPSAIIALFQLDCTPVGGTVMHFVQASQTTSGVSYGGTSYTPVDVQFEGLETSGVGALPQPQLILANTDGLIQALVNTYGDLNGCTLKRIRTFARYLDGQPDADNAAFFGPDVYKIERKSADTVTQVTWDLSAAIDQEGKQLPARPMIRSTCLWRYRSWNPDANNGAGAWDYTRVLCPYTGTKYWDVLNQPVTNPAKDMPSRTIDCCELRFGKGRPLPFGGFPGMGRNL